MSDLKPPSRLRLFLGGLTPKSSILQRYIGRELLVVVVLAAGILTGLLALCGVLKPLRQHAISTTEMVEILLLLFPVFLAFTLPFAVMLSCCWVYGRLADDNELNACSSSGINIQRLLIVPLLLGLLCLGLNFWLANWVIPNWALARVEGMLARHGRDIVYRKLRRQGSVRLDRTQIGRQCVIHADTIDGDRNVLKGIGVVVYGKAGQIEQIITAQSADVHFFSSAKDGGLPDSIAVVPRKATIVELPEYHTYKASRLVFRGRIGGGIRQHFNSMSLGELQAISGDPELYHSMRDLAEKARRVFITSRLVEKFQQQLDQQGYFELRNPENVYRFRGQIGQAVFNAQGASGFLKQAVIDEYDTTGSQQQRVFLNVDSLSLELFELPGSEQLTASIVLRNAHIRPHATGEVEVLERTRYSISDLAVPPEIIEQGRTLSLGAIKKANLADTGPHLLKKLGGDIAGLQRTLNKEIALEIHSRLAIAASCPVLALLGALLGSIFRKGQFLVAVGLSLGPAVISLLFVIMGKRMVDTAAFSTGAAVSVAWTGLILLSLINMVLFVRVLKR